MAYDYCRVNPRKGFVYNYTEPNKTLAHFDRKGNGAYFGDVKNGPFTALAGVTESPFLTKRGADGQIQYGNGTITMHNVRAWWYEILSKKPWPFVDHAFAWDDVKNYNYLPPGTPSDVEFSPQIPDVHFDFIGLDLERFWLRANERETPLKFDIAFVGANSTQFLTPTMFQAMKPDGVVVAETVKSVVDCEWEAKKAFIDKIKEFGTAGGWKYDAGITEQLHALAPKAKPADVTPTPHQLQSKEKLATPFYIALSKLAAA